MSDKDSLFGSPPPSPARGRSPSLALPENSGWRLDAQARSQNVGTIALPGSQKHSSELPVFLNPALPSGNPVLQLRPPAQTANAPRPRRSTSYTGNSTSCMPSPAPHTTRTDRTLRDLVGLISHFEPVVPSSSRPPPIAIPCPRGSQAPDSYPPGSAQNPIEIDAPGPADAVNSALIALAGTVASALKLPTKPQETPLSKPTVNNVLHCIKHDPKLIPALQATYEYLGSIPNNSQPPPRSFSHVTTNQPDPSSATRKKRKRNYSGPQVPAGAGHWDVPFPFAPGEEPHGYPSKWQLERGRRVLGELLGLFERGFAKARGREIASTAKASSQRQPKKKRIRVIEPVPGREVEESIVGISDDGSMPGAGAAGGLNYQRMTDWLSSVPPPPSSSIMDSTNLANIPSPSPSDPTHLSPNSLLDFLATLGPTFSDALPTGVDGKECDVDFGGAFDELYAGIGEDEMTSQALLGSNPASESIKNDIMGFSVPDSESTSLHTGTQEFVFDPPLTPSQQQMILPSQNVSQVPPAVLTPSTLPMDCQDPVFVASGALTSLTHSAAESPRQRLYDQSGVGTDLDLGDSAFLTLPLVEAFVTQHVPVQAAQSVDAHSLFTAPTASGSSSQRGSSTPTVYAQDSMSPDLSVNAGLPSSGKTKVERRAAVLAKAKEHREQLIRELERAQVQRWELLIEGGVLRNLEKADT